MIRQDILAECPPDFAKPDSSTHWKWLNRAVESNMILREGTGRKSDPFRYWLPEREAIWRQSPFYDIIEHQRQTLKLPFQSLQEIKRGMGDMDP